MATLTDLKKIKKALRDYIRKLVGEELSTMRVAGVQQPSVLYDISGGNLPDYPFIVISNDVSSGVQGTKIVDQFLDDQERLNIVKERLVSFNIKCCGDDAEAILNDLSIKNEFGYDRWTFQTEANAKFQNFSDIVYQPIYLSERFIQSSYMVANLVIRTTYIPSENPSATVGVNADGELISDNEGNNFEVSIEVNTNE